MHRLTVLLSGALACVLSSGGGMAAETPHQATTLIINARIVDGTGAPSTVGAVRIEGDRIVAIGKLSPIAKEQVIDAGGMALTPGFIDTHSHHDGGLAAHPQALPVLTQGITTIIAGQDGGSADSVGELFARFEKAPAAINMATYIGHNTVRDAVLGKDFKRQATPAEIGKMKALVREGMQAGAIGLSTGLEYDPGIYSSKAEVLELAKEAAKFKGRYISHMRSEDRNLWAALDELIEIGRQTRMPVQVSHMKLAMTDWWGQADRFIATMDRARAEGIVISGDVYPYEYWQSTLTVLFPERDFTNRKTAEFVLKSLAPANGLRLSDFSAELALVGKTVAEIAVARGTDEPQTLMDLIAESQKPGQRESVIGTSMHPDDIKQLIAWKHSNICTDGSMEDLHPRGAGSFTRVLRVYVREQGLLTLEAAVHKMSGAAAEHMGISDRGVIRKGAYADLLLFDPATVADHAKIGDAGQLSKGIAKVWVNGSLVLDEGKSTDARPGKLIRHKL